MFPAKARIPSEEMFQDFILIVQPFHRMADEKTL